MSPPLTSRSGAVLVTRREAIAGSIGRSCGFHDLRHTHASRLIAAGEHPKTTRSRILEMRDGELIRGVRNDYC